MAVLVRRKWWILGSFIIFAGLSGLFATIVPDTYISESTILIEPREISTEFVTDLNNSSTEQRLSIIQNTILSRTNLLKILDEFEDGLKEYRGLNDQVKVRELTDKINIEFPTERVRGSYLPITTIKISYRNRHQGLAHDITARLTELFLDADREARQENVNGTAEFFQRELDKVAEDLEQSEKTLEELKKRYRYELPSERETKLRLLDRLQIDKQSNIETLYQLRSLKLDLEQRMSGVPEEIPREQSASAARAALMDPAVQACRQKSQKLSEARANKSEIHPEVRRLKAELEQLKKGLPEGALIACSETPGKESAEDSKPAMVPNPAYLTLKSQLKQANTDIQIGEEKKKRIEEDMARIDKQVENTATVEQKFLEPLRINEDLKKQYYIIKGRLDEAKLSESAESNEKGTQLKNIDPASYPMEPAPPSRPVIFIIGMLLSLTLGIGVAFAVDIASPVVFTQSELERVLQAKILVEIPRISTPSDIRKSRILAIVYGLYFLVLTSAYGGVLYFLYTKKDKLAQILDPVIQRLQG